VSKVIELIIDVEPTAKGRPRTAYRNGGVRTYTPERTLIAQEAIVALLQPYKDQCFPTHIPVKLTCTFWRHKSKWLPRKESLPFRKPDLTNFAKLLEDAIIGILIPDDSQLTTVHLAKRWSPTNEGYITMRLEEDIE
jgi:Holliday junction resolvase RusA-like endonuclease